MAKTIVVLGATGTQGGSVVDYFLEDPGWTVRGVTRDPTSSSSQSLKKRGVEIVQGDQDDPKSLEPAFSGAHAIFAVTDFWNVFFPTYMKGEMGHTNDREIGELAYKIEVQRGKAIADAAAAVLEKEGKLERFIWSTLAPVKEMSKGKLTYVYHFDAKAAVDEYIETSLPALNEKMSRLLVGYYASNWNMGEFLMPKKDDNGVWAWKFLGSPQIPLPFVDTAADTGILTALLVNAPPGKKLLGVSEMLTASKFLEQWSEIHGVTARVEETKPEDLISMLPRGLGKELVESSVWVAEYGWGGGAPDVLMPKDIDPNAKTTSMEEYIRRADWSPLFGKQAKA